MIYKTFFLRTFLLIIVILNFFTMTWGQTNNFKKETIYKELFNPSGFSNDNRVKLLILNLLPSGLTEIAATEITKVLQLNIFNTNHFSVLGPSEFHSDGPKTEK